MRAKKVTEDEPPAKSKEEKLKMLEALLNYGVLTQEEFDSKKEKVF